MYPWIRLFVAMLRARRGERTALDAVSEVTLRVYPWDIDMFGELNNGRTMTLMDIGRIDQNIRSGFAGIMRREGWTVTLGGAAVRWRKRVTMGQTLTLRTRPVCRDARWVYFEQVFLRRGEPVAAAVMRACAVKNRKLVPTDAVARAAGTDWNPPMADWIRDWAAMEDRRPWPPAF